MRYSFLILPLLLTGCATTSPEMQSIADGLSKFADSTKAFVGCVFDNASASVKRDCERAPSVAEAERKAAREIEIVTAAVEKAAKRRGVRTLGVQVAQIPVYARGRQQGSITMLKQAGVEADDRDAKAAVDVLRDAAREIAPLRYTPVTFLIVKPGNGGESEPRVEQAGDGAVHYVAASAADVPKGKTRIFVVVRGVRMVEVE